MARKKKILIVDDFMGVRSIVRETLIKKDFEVVEASSALEALKFFDGTQIDLVITDYDMPDRITSYNVCYTKLLRIIPLQPSFWYCTNCHRGTTHKSTNRTPPHREKALQQPECRARLKHILY